MKESQLEKTAQNLLTELEGGKTVAFEMSHSPPTRYFLIKEWSLIKRMALLRYFIKYLWQLKI